MSVLSDMIRQGFGEGDSKRDAGLTTPESIERFDNIKYGTEDYWQELDVYRPKNVDGKLPVIVSVHGGGWVYGDKDRYQWYTMDLATRGFAVVNFTYRLAPEFKFPSSLEDTNSVFTWVLNHADEYGFDTENIFAVGDSAGAHNLGLYSCICTNPEFAANFEFKTPEGFCPKAIALNCGAFAIDITSTEESNQMTIGLMDDLLVPEKKNEQIKLIQVADFVTEKFPPVFFVTATGDFLKGEAPLMQAKLLENDVPHIFRFFGDKEHELGHVFMLNIRLDEAIRCNDEEADFFKRFVK